MARSRCPSVSVLAGSSLLFTCMTSVALPCAGEPSTRRETLVLTELSAYISVLKVYIHGCSCKEVTNYRPALVPGTVWKNCHRDKGRGVLLERNSGFPFFSETLYILYRYLHVFQPKLSRKSFVCLFHRPLNTEKLKIHCKARVHEIYGEKQAVTTMYNLGRGKQKEKKMIRWIILP